MCRREDAVRLAALLIFTLSECRPTCGSMNQLPNSFAVLLLLTYSFSEVESANNGDGNVSTANVTLLAVDHLTVSRCIGVGANSITFAGTALLRHLTIPQAVAVKVGYHNPYMPPYEHTEVQANSALSTDGHSHRNIVEYHGIARFPLVQLLGDGPLADGGWSIRARSGGRCSPVLNVTSMKLHEATSTGAAGAFAIVTEVLGDISLGAALDLLSSPATKASLANESQLGSLVEQAAKFRLALTKSHNRSAALSLMTRRHTTGGWDVLIGLAEGMHHMHKRGVVHRDLEGGVNVMLKTDKLGVTVALFDFGSGLVCDVSKHPLPTSARSTDIYAFGDILQYACYGSRSGASSHAYLATTCRGIEHVWHGTAFLEHLLKEHEQAHPGDRAIPAAGLLSRCNNQSELDDLSRYAWRPAVSLARQHASRGNLSGKIPVISSPEFSWPTVIRRLEALRKGNLHGLFRAEFQ